MRNIICILFVFLVSCDNERKNIALGTLERDRIAHTATVSEVVVALPVMKGTEVKKGTLLVKLDDTLQQAQLDKATADVNHAEASLEKLKNGARVEEVASGRAKVAKFKAALVESRANYERTVDLIKQNMVSKAKVDQTLAVRDANLAGLQNAQEQLRILTNGAREEDLRVAEAHLAAMLAILESEKKKLSDLSIVATRDGILDNLPWNLGERVTKGSPLAIILAGKAPFARIYVPEPYRIKVNVGDQMIVHVDGLDNPLTGTLRWIATEPAFTPYYALNQEERARLMYLAEIQLPDSAENLPNGVPAQVELP